MSDPRNPENNSLKSTAAGMIFVTVSSYNIVPTILHADPTFLARYRHKRLVSRAAVEADLAAVN